MLRGIASLLAAVCQCVEDATRLPEQRLHPLVLLADAHHSGHNAGCDLGLLDVVAVGGQIVKSCACLDARNERTQPEMEFAPTRVGSSRLQTAARTSAMVFEE